jgi:L-ascorbate metabolism protein UlaG (beta-lactamase superfamily)
MLTLTFHGHACFTAEGDGKRVIFDPFLTGNPKADIPADRVPMLDAILLSHGHGDHLGDAIPLARRDGATIVATSELAAFCEQQGAKAHAMHIGGSHRFPFGTVKLVPAFHGGGIKGDDGSHTTAPCGLVLTLGGKTVYHAGDTGLTLEMQLLKGRVDVMLVPIGDNYTMGIEDAARAVEFVQPRVVVPMHYNTWDVVAADPEAFRSHVGRAAGVVILAPGESHTIS